MSIIKCLTVVAMSCSVAMTAGCSKDNNKPFSPGFDDGAPPKPITEQVKTNIPEPMGLNKGMANKAIVHSISLTAGELDINKELRLNHILTGYNGFDEYVFEAQIRGDSQIRKLYASTGYYDSKLNSFVIDSEDILPSSKKILVI